MALLLAPFRWLVSSIIRLAILAAILVVAYLVLVKPAIEGGERTVRQTLHSLEGKAGASFKRPDQP